MVCSAAARDGGWAGTNWRSDWARGPEKNIRTWGQLGLTGEWADKPINVYGFSLRYNTATDFSDRVLKSSDKWNENIHGYGNIVNPDGSRYIEADQITDNLGRTATGSPITDSGRSRQGKAPGRRRRGKQGLHRTHARHCPEPHYPLYTSSISMRASSPARQWTRRRRSFCATSSARRDRPT